MVKKVHRTPSGHLGLLRQVEAHGMRKARAGNKNWLYVGTGLWTLRTVRRLAERREEILIHEKLKPGERIVISNARPTLDPPEAQVVAPLAPKGRRGRKAQRKADQRAAKQAAKATRGRRGRKARKAEHKANEAAAKAAAKQAKRAKRKPAASVD